MTSDLGEFLKSQWSTASPNQYGSRWNPIVAPAESSGQRLSNGVRVGAAPAPTGRPGLGSLAQTQAPPIGTTPETPVTAASIGVAQPNCGPKMQAVIDPNTGRWTCQPVSSGPSLGSLAVVGVLGYLAYTWWKDQDKGKRHHRPRPSEESVYEDE